MSVLVFLRQGRRHDVASRAFRLGAQMFRTRTLRPHRPQPLVSFTFDDIPDSAAQNGSGMLERHGARGTFYVSSGLFGTTWNDWTFATAAEIRNLAERGHEIACHTFSHPDVQRLTRKGLAADLDRNAAALDILAPGLTLRNFAYPYGSTALAQKRLVQNRFRSARGTREGLNIAPIDLGQLRAVRLYDHLLGPGALDRLVRIAVARAAWLIFYTHDVSAFPTEHGCTPQLLDSALLACRRHHCPVVTVDEALERLSA